MRSISALLFITLSILYYRIVPDYNLSGRDPASILGMSCLDHANTIILHKDWYYRNISKLIAEREDLKDYYKYFKSSIDDFDQIKSEAMKSQVKLLKDGETSLAAKIGLIRKAKSTLDISYYIFSDDEIGNMMLNEVRKAVARGVHVRVLVDSTTALNSSFYSDQFKSLLKFRGPKFSNNQAKRMGKAEVVVFNNMFNPRKLVSSYINRVKNLFRSADNQIPISDSTINRRLHDKILLMDAEDPKNSMAIIGGRNIANEYHTLDSFRGESFEFEDMDVLIKDTKDIRDRTEASSLTTHIQSYYDKLFYHIGNNHLANAIVRLSRKAFKKEIKKMSRVSRRTLNANPKFKARLNDMIEGDFFEEGFDNGLVRVVNEIQNIHSPWGRIKYEKVSDLNPNSISKELWDQMQQAEMTIDIITPYAHFTDKEMEFIKSWLKENPNRRFRLVTSSLATNDTLASQALIDHSLMPKLLDDLDHNQIQVFYYGKEDDVVLGGDKAYGKLHAKYAVFDDERSIVMTSNLDPRSRSLNSEVGVSLETENIAKELTEKTEDIISMSHQYGDSEWERINQHPSLKWQRMFSKIIHMITETFNLERNI
jgi:putative cardiolipin synthase